MRWREYPRYKPSGVEWLGDVPDIWPVTRLRFRAKINPSKAEISVIPGDTAVSFVTMEAVGESGGLRLDETKLVDEVANGYTYFREGDVVVAKITPCFENWKGSVTQGLENGLGFGTTELHVIRPADDLDRRYLFYLTITHPFVVSVRHTCMGLADRSECPTISSETSDTHSPQLVSSAPSSPFWTGRGDGSTP